MKVYFLRHAAALDGPVDAARPLSPGGRRQARKLARFLRRAGVQFDLAFTSPLVRARQTIEAVCTITNQGERIEPQVTEALLNDTSPAAFAQWLEALPKEGHVLLVGHEPSLSAHVRRMLELKNAVSLELAKGAVACIKTTDQRRGVLKFLITPKSLGLGRDRPA
ncbi:MAG: phosphohistidine phosphatase SixA [Proteobacteria bacterium]|nr:phosphohistidine phosphatase SixA [Pseudomonadota bacterium]